MLKIGGYYLPFSSARKVAENLGIDVGEPTVFNDRHMEWPINTWLFENNMPHILTARVDWPLTQDGVTGTLFATRFHEDWFAELKEADKDLKVRAWLEECGADRETIQWISLLDEFDICIRGIHPKPSPFTGFDLEPKFIGEYA